MNARPASTTRIILAFLAVYIIWGSTYLAIRFAVETMPPFLMAGTRFGSAGLAVYGWLRLRGAPRPTRSEWIAATIAGAFLILGGNGILSWSEQYVPSGLAALLVAMVPIWLVAIARFGPEKEKPGGLELLGLSLGLTGVTVLLLGSDAEIGLGGASSGLVLLASLGVVVASISWAIGSMYTRRARLPALPLYATALTMTAGGALQILVGLGLGELRALDLGAVSARSWGSLVYLSVFGSIVAFSAYAWLLRVVRPAVVGTYAYVNPIVAVFLGWQLAGERLTPAMWIGTIVIVSAVVLAQRGRG
ncbi:MAG: EamA family transporter [Gemmatimonadetes bacterium]|nr:EamA family transporter [Gemmatimonadota bacterium]